MKRRALKTILVSALAAAALCGCGAARRVYQAATRHTVKVTTDSMLPTLKPGDSLVAEIGYYVGNPVNRFDVVLHSLPPGNALDTPGFDKNAYYVHRVVGLGGETLEIKDGRVYVNGQALDEPFATKPFDAREHYGPLKIPEGEFFLLGDNRSNSWDSRYWATPTLSGQYIPAKVLEVLPQ